MPMAMASDIDVSFIRLNHYASMSLPLACFLCIAIYSTPGTSASSETVHEYDVIRHNNGIKDKVKDNDDVTSQKLILILSDGLRWDYFRQNMTGFQRMFSTGVKAEHMIPSFPALSYTNYYSIATGLHPESHGMIHNFIYDSIRNTSFLIGETDSHFHPYWWEDGDPIWITAARQKKRSHMFWWPGCDVEIRGLRPDYCLPVFGVQTDEQMSWAINSTVELLRNDSTDFVALYYWNTDSDGHHYGPFSPQLERTLDSLDSQILRLQRLLDAVVSDRRQVALSSFVNIIVVSDHGMKLVSTARRPKQHVNIFRHIRRAQLFMFLLKGPVGQLWPVKSQLDDVYKKLKSSGVKGMSVYLKNEIPERYHYRNHHRVAPIILVLDPYYTFHPSAGSIGEHGYDNNIPDMWSIFVAKGPAFKANYTASPLSCVELYQVMCSILGLTASPHNGTWAHVIDMLSPAAAHRRLPPSPTLVVVLAAAVAVLTAAVAVVVWRRRRRRSRNVSMDDVKYSAVMLPDMRTGHPVVQYGHASPL